MDIKERNKKLAAFQRELKRVEGLPAKSQQDWLNNLEGYQNLLENPKWEPFRKKELIKKFKKKIQRYDKALMNAPEEKTRAYSRGRYKRRGTTGDPKLVKEGGKIKLPPGAKAQFEKDD